MATRRIAAADVLAVLFVLVGGCGAKLDPTIGFGTGAWQYPASLDRVVPERFQQSMRRAKSVEVALVASASGAKGRPTGIEDWSLRSDWVALPAARRHEVEALVLDRRHWQTIAKKCEFQPGVAIRWTSKADTAIVLVCLNCFDMMGRAGKTFMGGPFDPSADAWLDWARRTFKEPAFQSFVARKIAERRANKERIRVEAEDPNRSRSAPDHLRRRK